MNDERNTVNSIDDKKYWLILENYELLGSKYHEYAAAGKEIYYIATEGFNIPQCMLPPIEHWYCMLGAAGIIDTLVDNEIKDAQDLTTSSLVIAELFQYIRGEEGEESICNYENLGKAINKLGYGEKILLFECGVPLFRYYFSRNPQLLAETYYIFGCRLKLPHSETAEDIISFRSIEAIALSNFFTLTIEQTKSERDLQKIQDFSQYLYSLIAWGNTLDSFLDFNEDIDTTYYKIREMSSDEQLQIKQKLFQFLAGHVQQIILNPGSVKTILAITKKRALHMFKYITTGSNKY